MSRVRICRVFVINFFIQLAAAMVLSGADAAMQWYDTSRNIGNGDLSSVAVSQGRADIVYAGSSKALFRTSGRDGLWEEVLSFRGSEKGINAIAVSPVQDETVYAGTDNGLYQSIDRGSQWERIYTGMGLLENSVLSIAVHPQHPDRLYVGTLSGMYFTGNRGKDWTRAQNIPSGAIVLSIAIDPAHPDIMYAAADTGVYKSLNSGSGWKRVLGSSLHEKDYLIPELLSTGETNYEEYHEVIVKIKEAIKIRSIAIDRSDGSVLYAGTAEGLLISRDSGRSWSQSSELGLLGRSIRGIISPPGTDFVYAATGRGVFRYSKKMDIWEGLYRGLSSSDVRSLSVSTSHPDQVILWAATKKGAYRGVPEEREKEQPVSETGTEDPLALFQHEPSAGEIIEAAIEYADVQPEKIKKWRKAAGYRALLPDLRFGYDRGKDWQSSDYFYSTSKEKYRDDDITEGQDKGWSVSLTWELGDLIWNNDQTSIDNRSKLMVQLRDDILNEVTRLYFERRRLQVEMRTSPPADRRGRIEKELRLQELTAGIDALTGSYLSNRLAQSGSGAYRTGVK